MITKAQQVARQLWRRANEQPKRLLHWYVLGTKATPPPDVYKQQLVKRMGQQFALTTFVETGTYRGDMTAAASRVFSHVYSIELHTPFYEKARARFAGNEKVHILHGDSATTLRTLLQGINEPTLFWLDAHGGQSSKDAAGKEAAAPVRPELEAILAHSLADTHVILVDDIHTFVRNVKWGEGVWAQIETLRTAWLAQHPDWFWKVKDNVLHIYKNRA